MKHETHTATIAHSTSRAGNAFNAMVGLKASGIGLQSTHDADTGASMREFKQQKHSTFAPEPGFLFDEQAACAIRASHQSTQAPKVANDRGSGLQNNVCF